MSEWYWSVTKFNEEQTTQRLYIGLQNIATIFYINGYARIHVFVLDREYDGCNDVRVGKYMELEDAKRMAESMARMLGWT